MQLAFANQNGDINERISFRDGDRVETVLKASMICHWRYLIVCRYANHRHIGKSTSRRCAERYRPKIRGLGKLIERRVFVIRRPDTYLLRDYRQAA